MTIAEAIVYPPYLPEEAAARSKDGPTLAQAYPHGLLSMSHGTTVYDAISRLGDSFEQMPLAGPSPYVKPGTVMYSFDGKPRRWDVVEALPSVGIVVYHTELQAFLVVRQFRPPVYAQKLREAQAEGLPPPPKSTGFVYELCAGVVDKAKSLKQIAREEVLEEVGYDVPVEALVDLGSALASAGTSGAPHHMYITTVDESMRAAGAGGGLQHDAECIEVLALPLEQVDAWVLDPSLAKSPGAMFGLVWGYHAVKAGRLGGGKIKAGAGGGGSSSISSNPNLTEELTLRAVLPS